MYRKGLAETLNSSDVLYRAVSTVPGADGHVSHNTPGLQARVCDIQCCCYFVYIKRALQIPPECSFLMEYDIHTVLDFLTLAATLWVIYELRVPLKDTYQSEQDSVQTYFVVQAHFGCTDHDSSESRVTSLIRFHTCRPCHAYC